MIRFTSRLFARKEAAAAAAVAVAPAIVGPPECCPPSCSDLVRLRAVVGASDTDVDSIETSQGDAS